MSKTWYPVLNYEECIECGACINKCQRRVYKLDGTRPVVVNPVGCIQGCHGCGDLCPVGAIEYAGENTGWLPPGKKAAGAETASCCETAPVKNSGCCSGNSGCCAGSWRRPFRF